MSKNEMNKNKLVIEVEQNVCALEKLTSTFSALDIALMEGSAVLNDNFLAIPCEKLREISSNITKLTDKLFEII